MNKTSFVYYDDEETSNKIVLDLSNKDISTTSEINGHINNLNNLIYSTLNLSNNLISNSDFHINRIINIKYCTNLILDQNDLDNLILKNLPRNIKKISCRSNNIKDFDSLVLNGKIKTIQDIDLSNNSIGNIKDYRIQLLNKMPSLRLINGMKVTKEERRFNKKK